MTTQQYHIDGMSCAACSSAVERVTRKLNGVESSNVNLTTNRMVITYDESQVTPEMICEKVSKAGFSASLIVEEEQNKKKEEEEWQQQEEQLEAVKRRVVTAICFAVPLLYISMGHMLPFTLPLPAFMQMDKNPLNFALAQLILTVPVLICGRKFYLVGIRSLLKGNPNMDSLVAIGTGSAFIYSLVMTFGIPGDHMKAHQLYYERLWWSLWSCWANSWRAAVRERHLRPYASSWSWRRTQLFSMRTAWKGKWRPPWCLWVSISL